MHLQRSNVIFSLKKNHISPQVCLEYSLFINFHLYFVVLFHFKNDARTN